MPALTALLPAMVTGALVGETVAVAPVWLAPLAMSVGLPVGLVTFQVIVTGVVTIQ